MARAYQSYRKNQTGGSLDDSKITLRGQRVNKGTINNSDFKDKALNLNFIKTLQGKDLKAFTMLLTNDSTVRNDFVKQNIKDLLNSQNKEIFNNLPMEAKKAFFNNLPMEEKKAFVQSQITVNKEYFQEILQMQQH